MSKLFAPHHVELDYQPVYASGKINFASGKIDFGEPDKGIRRLYDSAPTMRKEVSNMDKLFEYAVIFHPKVTKAATDNAERIRSQLLIEPTHILARDEAEVRAKAIRQIDAEYDDKLDQVEVLVRPFA